ncbi:hypothetical protein A2291_00480 [candidate division WOR-1 bacterium RIFOXYB2_FULL_42_35]|uniref:Uncharacterized protein n=1 Tax=candidate division WOR-1 bacterium RIFOXYC2_FULL_41_25 TaxID=1802586 RepID=A0A1F4TNY5_UNCSA|nr:MAG: hypothetical protein A2247_08045 [candidate division WOR-1 bacterium RIFOXYA2_FULL_41_14]OGC23709.1 MAG: hypothetical protein A2291_00480 [candidate division WOR-1 bacterium RIFOXYB2_FULL_42_35]OGC34422.1 MAG: hypothetical protein A2462_01245 [candidate division WOR-1 bacterium RIFOXYC2_FULL_41_25]
MSQQLLLAALIGFLLGIILLSLCFYIFRTKLVISSPAQKEFSEQEIEELLVKSGFQIISKRVKESIIININGKDHYSYLEADYLVSKGKEKYVVVVKTGEGTTDANEPNLRRRLLEYYRVFSTRGILLVDQHKGEIHLVKFRFPHERNLDFFFHFFMGLLVILFVIGIIWLLAHLRFF